MTDEKNTETKPFPGSPTGNQSGVGGSHSGNKSTKTDKEPTAPYPGSPTGNASGVEDTAKEQKHR
jgi:hypothetical protein